MDTLLGVLIPFIGTTIGASFVFFMKKNINKKFEQILIGFASGVMIAASVWSLIIPAIEMAEERGSIAWYPPAIGFCIGVLTLMLLDKLIHHLEKNGQKVEIKNKLKKNTMLVLAVTLHNIPEGMAVGVVFAGLISGASGITLASAFALATGIAIQNFPEGAINGIKSFSYGVLSGIVEPIGAGLTILLTSLVVPILPYILAFAAGAMIYVVVVELIPESSQNKYAEFATVGVALGFTIMMILDVALG